MNAEKITSTGIELPPDGRFLLCRPRAGLNDTLCQIEKCWKYALEFDRILIIDTRTSAIKAKFTNFFEPKVKSPRIIFDASKGNTFKVLNRLTCFPTEIRGRLDRLDLAKYSPEYSPLNYVLRANTSIPSTFDFSKDHAQAVLVHEQSGGGSLSFELLKKIRISSKIRPEVLDRISNFDGKYHAVHVRNTDLKTDYKDLFSRISPEVKGKRLLVCSDDPIVISYARSYFNSSEILTSSEIPDIGGKPLHLFGNARKSTIDTIVDLIALGKSEKLFFSFVSEGRPSGFSGLAGYLSQNKYLIDALIEPSHIDASRMDLTLARWRLKQYLRRAKEYLWRVYFKTRRFKLGSTADRSR